MTQIVSDFLDEETPLPIPFPGLGTRDEGEEHTSTEVLGRIAALARCMDYPYGPLPGLILTKKDSVTPTDKPQGVAKEQSPSTGPTDKPPLLAEVTENSSPSLITAQKTGRSVRPLVTYAWAASLILSILLLSGILRITTSSKLSQTEDSSNTATELLECENSSQAPDTSSKFSLEEMEVKNFTESQPKPKIFYTLASQNDYPSVLAWACGYKAQNGLQALKKIQELNPQINWKTKKVFHQGERFETPCELTPELVERARYEVYKHHKLRRTSMKHAK